MLSGNEISQILLSLLLTYFGGRGNRPRWIAWGVAISAISCFILAVPHLLYGPGSEALSLTKEHLSYLQASVSLLEEQAAFNLTNSTYSMTLSGKKLDELMQNKNKNNECSKIFFQGYILYWNTLGTNKTNWSVVNCSIFCLIGWEWQNIEDIICYLLGSGRGNVALCTAVENEPSSDDGDTCSASHDTDTKDGNYSMVPIMLVFLSQFVLGIGTTLYYALGQIYLDDNTRKTNTPLLLGKNKFYWSTTLGFYTEICYLFLHYVHFVSEKKNNNK